MLHEVVLDMTKASQRRKPNDYPRYGLATHPPIPSWVRRQGFLWTKAYAASIVCQAKPRQEAGVGGDLIDTLKPTHAKEICIPCRRRSACSNRRMKSVAWVLSCPTTSHQARGRTSARATQARHGDCQQAGADGKLQAGVPETRHPAIPLLRRVALVFCARVALRLLVCRQAALGASDAVRAAQIPQDRRLAPPA